jgi:hypothetical protein
MSDAFATLARHLAGDPALRPPAHAAFTAGPLPDPPAGEAPPAAPAAAGAGPAPLVAGSWDEEQRAFPLSPVLKVGRTGTPVLPRLPADRGAAPTWAPGRRAEAAAARGKTP